MRAIGALKERIDDRRRDGKVEPLTVVKLECGYTHHAATLIKNGTTRISWINRSVNLQDLVVISKTAKHPTSEAEVKTLWGSNRDHVSTNTWGRVLQKQRPPNNPLNFDQRQVCLGGLPTRIGNNNPGILAAIGPLQVHPRRSVNDM